MKKITLSGWNVGFDKIGLTKLLRTEFGYSLGHAKSVTDAVLEGQPVTLELGDDQIEGMTSKLNRLGVNYEIGKLD
jgi:hypothetical protein